MPEESKGQKTARALAETPDGPDYLMAYKGGFKGGLVGGAIGAIIAVIACFICHYLLGS